MVEEEEPTVVPTVPDLQALIRSGDADGVSHVLPTADVGADSEGVTPLMLAAQLGHPGMVRQLLADQRVADSLRARRREDEWTAFMMAASHGHLDVARLLLERNPGCLADRSKERLTPLMAAASSGHSQLVEWLVQQDQGASSSIDAVNCEGMTALAHAARDGREQAALVLLQYGASANVRDLQGRTPAQHALSDFPELAQALQVSESE